MRYIRPLLQYLDWRPWERDKKITFLINTGIGLAVGITFLFVSHMHFMENTFNSTVDKTIRRETTTFLKRWEKCAREPAGNRDCRVARGKLSDKIVFIDIDDAAFTKWGEPLILPRDKIAHFVTLAEKNEAKVLVFDILFDYPSQIPTEDAGLRKVLEDMTRRRSSLKIVFPTMTRKADNTIRRNIFDDVIDKNPNFQRGIPYLSLSKTDKVVRYIRYYDIANTKTGKKAVVWGVPLLATVLYNDDVSALRELEPKIVHAGTHYKEEHYTVELSDKKRLAISNNELFSNRIRFALVPPGVLNSEGNLFTERILPDEVEALQKDLKDKVVIIGTSSQDKEGWYPTPVGDMPGFYIIGNAINMLLGDWQMRDAPIWVSLFLEIFIVVFASYMFIHFQPTVARILTTVLGFALLVPITYYFFVVYGIFINSILLSVNVLIPVLAMGWHQRIRTIKNTIKNIIQTRGSILAPKNWTAH